MLFGKFAKRNSERDKNTEKAFVGLDDDMIVIRMDKMDSISDEDEVLDGLQMKDESFTKLD